MYFMDYPFTSCLETLNRIYYTLRGDIPIENSLIFPWFLSKNEIPWFIHIRETFSLFPWFAWFLPDGGIPVIRTIRSH